MPGPGRPRSTPRPPAVRELAPLHLARLADPRTNRQIAEAAGISPQAVSDFFRGASPDPAASTVFAIARGLGMGFLWVGGRDLTAGE